MGPSLTTQYVKGRQINNATQINFFQEPTHSLRIVPDTQSLALVAA